MVVGCDEGEEAGWLAAMPDGFVHLRLMMNSERGGKNLWVPGN